MTELLTITTVLFHGVLVLESIKHLSHTSDLY